MNTASALEKFPDLRSFISASPVFLQWFRTYRQSVLKPVIELFKAVYHGDEALTYYAIHGAEVRLKAHLFPYLDPDEATVRIHGWGFETKSLSEKDWCGSLPFLCELFKQRQDADALISEYAVEAWNKLLGEARVRTQRDPSFAWLPEFDQPLVLSPSEIVRFEQGFLSYDYERHDIYYDFERLDGTVPPEMSRPAWDHRPSDLEGSSLANIASSCIMSTGNFVEKRPLMVAYLVGKTLEPASSLKGQCIKSTGVSSSYLYKVMASYEIYGVWIKPMLGTLS
ncbi:hypothetical protein FCIRC_5804 [Fusarium circinatum]|uniref:Uncharacterized protein n=1 Tax=Fusarium circinatum TaxID=48490 RepID=A0A8H5U0H3_FUSCI|nr:hypothetical protein FCIRC_5804 [Fusarium circinatum]